MALPGPGEWGWTGEAAQLDWNYGADPAAKDYALAYAAQRQAGLPHERAVLRAQMETKGFRDQLAQLVAQHGPSGVLMGRQVLRDDRRYSLNPYPATARNDAWARQPLSSPLPPQVIDLGGEASQGELNLRAVTRNRGRYASPTKVSNPPSSELLAALASGRAVDQPAAPAAAPEGQLPIDWSARREQLEQVVAQAAAAPTPKAPSSSAPEGWRRMAGRWGLPALAALGGFTALAMATGVEQPREQQAQPV